MRFSTLFATGCIASTLAACQTNPNIERVVASNRTTRLASYGSNSSSCVSGTPPVVQAIAVPASGRVTVRNGMDYPAFPVGHERYACNKRLSKAAKVFYTPARGFVGRDNVTINVNYSSGNVLQRTFDLTVR